MLMWQPWWELPIPFHSQSNCLFLVLMDLIQTETKFEIHFSACHTHMSWPFAIRLSLTTCQLGLGSSLPLPVMLNPLDQESGPLVPAIILEPCDISRELYLGAHIVIIRTVQNESHTLYVYIIKFQFNKSGSHNLVEHMIETWLTPHQQQFQVEASYILNHVINLKVGPIPIKVKS